MNEALNWLDRLRNLPLPPKLRIMNVCGGHERAITTAGLRALLPESIELIAGPGCPVCICPEEDVYEAIQLAVHERVTLLAFGDMLRVPVNAPKNEFRSLEQAKAGGADIRPIASPLEAVRIANAEPQRTIVLFATGFETTTAPVAAMLAAGVPDNLFVLLSARRTWPAVAMLLASGEVGFDALVAPGHVATIMGTGEWEFVPRQYNLPTAVAGFRADTLLAAIYSVARQHAQRHSFLDNCYPEVVREHGNPLARRLLDDVLQIVSSNWRGIGIIPDSGFELREAYASHDARRALPSFADVSRKRVGEMPPGCDCARVVLGRLRPNECRLYGRACTPRSPIGPCMVSDEGACRIWWASGVRDNASARSKTPIGSDTQ